MEIGIAIIESLKDSERKTGYELFESTLKYISFQKSYLENEFFNINDKNELLTLLVDLYKKATKQSKLYFLHFEMHGDKNGIYLKNDDFISWRIILPYLRNFNVLYKNTLSVYFAVCEGNNIIRYINHTERAPFAVMIGSFQKIYNLDIIKIFEEFYTIFFNKFSTLDAFNTIKNLDLKSEFTLITSQYIIKTFLAIEEEYEKKEALFEVYKINQDFFLMKDIL